MSLIRTRSQNHSSSIDLLFSHDGWDVIVMKFVKVVYNTVVSK